jgi:hypothetical protein
MRTLRRTRPTCTRLVQARLSALVNFTVLCDSTLLCENSPLCAALCCFVLQACFTFKEQAVPQIQWAPAQ